MSHILFLFLSCTFLGDKDYKRCGMQWERTLEGAGTGARCSVVDLQELCELGGRCTAAGRDLRPLDPQP